MQPDNNVSSYVVNLSKVIKNARDYASKSDVAKIENSATSVELAYTILDNVIRVATDSAKVMRDINNESTFSNKADTFASDATKYLSDLSEKIKDNITLINENANAILTYAADIGDKTGCLAMNIVILLETTHDMKSQNITTLDTLRDAGRALVRDAGSARTLANRPGTNLEQYSQVLEQQEITPPPPIPKTRRKAPAPPLGIVPFSNKKSRKKNATMTMYNSKNRPIHSNSSPVFNFPPPPHNPTDTNSSFIGGSRHKKSLSLKKNKLHKHTTKNHKSRKTYNTHNTHNTQKRKKHNKQISHKNKHM